MNKAFVDTNILVYVRDTDAGVKQSRAADLVSELWKSRLGRISTQVMSEYYVTVTQKLKPGMTREAAWADLQSLQAWGPLPVDWKLMERGRSLQKEHAVSWWDALIIAAAQTLDCSVIFTEDLAHGQHYDMVNIVNPFRGAG
ncbi:MAG TPA: PIN domain-containing protein [Kiritimatiellia bacterium]|nr:PIN domain-containing protein [Kiritimatiellia bacterium]